MKLFTETLIVGCYSLLISSLILNTFNYNPLILNAFIIGFIKHFIAGISGIYRFYCSNKLTKDCTHNFDIIKLIYESTFEGILFTLPIIVILLLTTYNISKNILYIIFFIIGSFLHISFENLGFHQTFCVNYCN